MNDPLASDALMEHVRALAGEIGPRPAGHPAEAQARQYVRRALARAGIEQVEEMPFGAWDTWTYLLATPTLLSLAGNALERLGRDGWLANWRRYSDTVENVQPAGVERAARFALAMMHTLDERETK